MIGIVSLLLWALILIVTLKYVVLMLQADNRGEGGTLSLLALAQRAVGSRTPLLLGLGIAGAALFYGDAAITPAISVLSAVEGLKLVTPVLEPLRFANHRHDPLCSFLGAEPRHRAGLSMVRPGHAGVVRDPGRAWIAPRLRPAADLPCDRPIDGGRLPRRARARVVRGDGLGVPRGDRSRGALRRHGPFRPGADPLGLVGGGVSGARAQLPRPGQPRPRTSRSSRKLLLPARPGLGPARARSACNGGHRHRKPSGDYRRLFSDPAGRPARPSASFRNPAHVGRDARPDLYAEGQRAPARGGPRPDGPLRQLLRARQRLRHRSHRRNGGRLALSLHRCSVSYGAGRLLQSSPSWCQFSRSRSASSART